MRKMVWSAISGGFGTMIVLALVSPALGEMYISGATAVVKDASGPPTIDDGVVICTSGGGVGGACVPFGTGDSIAVLDDAAGPDVAFQVCIDNNGDSVCTFQPGSTEPCGDDVFFSHDDFNNFYNPLGRLPTSFRPGCPGGFPGYVVFLCEGVHTPKGGGAPHVHPATAGSTTLTTGGTGFGNFCGGPAVVKRYQVF
jgi:hypothetical protein